MSESFQIRKGLPDSERLRIGQPVVVGSKIYQRCLDCGGIVRINKPIIGDLHFCVEQRP